MLDTSYRIKFPGLALLLLGMGLGLGQLTGCAAFTEHSVGLAEGELTHCPQWPRCVSSQAQDPDKRIAPLRLTAPPVQAWVKIHSVVENMPRTRVVVSNAHYLHAEVISPWRFYVDDLELLLEPQSELIHVRSSGRIGYYDFQVNRDRVEALRDALAELNLVAGK